MIDETQLRAELRRYIRIEYETNAEFAAATGISAQYLSNMLSGRRAIPQFIYTLILGYERVEAPVKFKRVK